MRKWFQAEVDAGHYVNLAKWLQLRVEQPEVMAKIDALGSDDAAAVYGGVEGVLRDFANTGTVSDAAIENFAKTARRMAEFMPILLPSDLKKAGELFMANPNQPSKPPAKKANVVRLSVSFSTDADGYLARECPSCVKQFKVVLAEIEQQPEFTCPYCAVKSGAQSWWTPAQLESIADQSGEKVLGPYLDEMEKTLKEIERSSRGLLKATMTRSRSKPRTTEPNADDMVGVDAPCHPDAKLKILPTSGPTFHCFFCGTQHTRATAP